jgi:RNA polymerase sigma-54 factor
VADKETLKEHLLSQARLSDRSGGELSILEAVITSLDDRGFLTRELGEYAADLDVPEERLREAVAEVQCYDPVGCAVWCVEESIEVQARFLYPDDTLLHRVIREHFHDLERLDHGKIAHALHVPVQRIIEKNGIIRDLDPYPGRRFSPGAVNYVLPDIEVKLVSGEIIVILNDDWIPRILVNPYYLSFLGKKNIEKNLKEYIQGKVKSARNLVRNISGRRATIYRVADSIMAHQRAFLEKGPGHLNPLTLGDVAREVNLHESTVSRVTSGKYAQTSWGIFDLKYFFVTKLKSSGGDASADRAMKRVAEIIGSESADNPHSDEKVAALLASEGIHLARRTVAKYREALGIPASGRRGKINRLKTEERL